MGLRAVFEGTQADMIEHLEGVRDGLVAQSENSRTKARQDEARNEAAGVDRAVRALQGWTITNGRGTS
jgi:hypothetical protein